MKASIHVMKTDDSKIGFQSSPVLRAWQSPELILQPMLLSLKWLTLLCHLCEGEDTVSLS